MEDDIRYSTISIRVPKYLADDYYKAMKYVGINRTDCLGKYVINQIGQVNKLKRLEKKGREKEYTELLLKLRRGKEEDI